MPAAVGRFKVLGVNDERDTCDCCGKTGLKRVVWIEDTDAGDIKCFGTTCAQQPAKGFRCDAAIQRAVREFVADEKFALKLAYRQYRQAGGKLNADYSYANQPLFAECLAGAKAYIAAERSRVRGLSRVQQ